MTETRRASACPSCGAAAKAEATFCGQCYADFRPPPPPPVVAAPAVVAPAQRAAYGVPGADPLTAPLLDVVLPVAAPAAAAPGAVVNPLPVKVPTWPCTRCDTANPIDASICSLCGGGFLAVVSEQGRISMKLPVVGDISRYSRGQRAGIAIGALLVLLLPLALITLLLTKSPGPGSGSDSTRNNGPATSTGTTIDPQTGAVVPGTGGTGTATN
jgi:hypothetical protein